MYNAPMFVSETLKTLKTIMTYRASLDKLAIGITVAVTILFAIIITGQYSIMRDVNPSARMYMTVVLILIYLFAFAFRPINYKITSEQLIIHRLLGDKKIDRSQIKSVEALDNDQMRWTIRTFGVGGLFGYYGKFANKKLGSMTWYATRRDKYVLVRTIEDKKIILTPDEPVSFVADFNR
jgi:hypothetical protein